MPSILLSDNGVSSGSAGLKTTASNDGILALQTTTAGGAATTAVTINTSQNVGIGTTSPATPLDVIANSSALNLRLRGRSSDSVGQMEFWNNASSTRYGYIGADSTAVNISTQGSLPLLLGTNATERMRVNAGAPILCLAGGNTSATGTGIAFPATQSASSDANTLDDYEEGTFTATFRGSVTAGTYTTSSQAATYTKIGRQVFITISTSGFNAASGGTGYMQITGLPFVNTQSVSGAVQGNFLDVSAGTLWVVADFIGSSGHTTIYFREVKDAGNGNDFSIAGLSTSTSSVVVSLVYNTST